VGLVFIAAFTISSGSTVSDMHPPPLAGLSVAENVRDPVLSTFSAIYFQASTQNVQSQTHIPSHSQGICTITPTGAIQNFYNDLSPDSTAQQWASQISPTAINVLNTPVTASAHETPAFTGRMSYIHCTKDNAIDLSLQKRMVAKAGIEKVATLETDHCPFLTMPVKTAEFVMEHISSFE